ncbi:MAG: hypothetical protein IH986_15195 [Planctomycetes bacterium]|nr:hypothetical protein [Planctomycetota bacterium]
MPGETDMDSQMRVWDGDGNGIATVDMGADEFGSFAFGDLNCDGAFNGADIDPFFLALGDPAAYAIAFPNCDPLLGDMNSDGRLDGGDIDPFFACLGGGACPKPLIDRATAEGAASVGRPLQLYGSDRIGNGRSSSRSPIHARRVRNTAVPNPAPPSAWARSG